MQNPTCNNVYGVPLKTTDTYFRYYQNCRILKIFSTLSKLQISANHTSTIDRSMQFLRLTLYKLIEKKFWSHTEYRWKNKMVVSIDGNQTSINYLANTYAKRFIGIQPLFHVKDLNNVI